LPAFAAGVQTGRHCITANPRALRATMRCVNISFEDMLTPSTRQESSSTALGTCRVVAATAAAAAAGRGPGCGRPGLYLNGSSNICSHDRSSTLGSACAHGSS
jgi:hypothetical protein